MYAGNALPLLAAIFTATLVRWTVWTGLVLLTGALVVLVRTQWGQSNPLRKCIVLSLIAHLLLAIYTTTVQIVTGSGPANVMGPVAVSIVGGDGGEAEDVRAWDDFADGEVNIAAVPAPADDKPVPAPTLDRSVPQTPTTEPTPGRAATVEESAAPVADLADSGPAAPAPIATPIEVPAPQNKAAPETAPDVPAPSTDDGESQLVEVPRSKPADPEKPATSLPATRATDGKLSQAASSVESADGQRASPAPLATAKPGAGEADSGAGSLAGGGNGGSATGGAVTGGAPNVYKNRAATGRTRVAQAGGGSIETEAAVAAALHWLVRNQDADGRWNARQLGAGRETMLHGHNRLGAGTQADAGISGLALLALLGAGNTHLEGEHKQPVRRGLEYLLRIQTADGNLAGNAAVYEKMYCHAMASFALSEAYAMSRDPRMHTAVRQAVQYTVNAQHRESGGWRYAPGDPGDMSQMGWQLMALKSAELAGIKMPDQTRDGMVRFIKSVSSGKSGGLAGYRLGQPATRTMTAEALVCRQFLGMTRDNPAGREAADFLLQEVPGQGQSNVYYWYYATLGLYQLGGPRWANWNEGMTSTLLRSQCTTGDLAGSWDPDETWGAYGGRGFSTALSALCLEVYYRFLPLYVEAARLEKGEGSRQKAKY